MRMLRSMRLMFLAILVSLIPASSYAGVFVSVGFAPPVLPVYVQPPCPEPGLMWTPGYWGYGPDGYYWVPGAWVPAPYVGALWTPGYWGWGGGLYVWHPGYWGQHVGYYGGVNYGFGYMGIGFAGGMWRGGVFAYNSAVMHVGIGGAWGGNRVYVDRTVVERTTIINNTHISYNGGPGGIRHDPAPEERIAEHDQHLERTSFQTQHADAAMHDHSAYFNANHGHPANLAAARPLQAENHPAPANRTVINNNVNINRNVNENRSTVNNNYNRSNTENNYNRSNNNFNRGNNENNVNRPANNNHPASQEHSNPRPQENHGGGHEEGHGHGR
jgi:YXWGXW repeat-containing protein